MLPGEIKQSLISYFSGLYGKFDKIEASAVSGGSINETFKIVIPAGKFFLKFNDAGLYPGMFEKEAAGLKLLGGAGEIEVPEVLQSGEAGRYSYLLLSYIEQARETANFWEDFGKRLAGLHSHKAERFGLDHDNYMGSLYQHNAFHDEWVEFFVQERLERQVKLAREDGKIGRQDVSAFERLYARLAEIFPETKPSLVHGDLWSGNFMAGSSGQACLIDPAVYYGHPEVDIAMSTLFGGFSAKFYDSYTDYYPLEKGWRQRLDFYNLYPLMVHVNLFVGGYLGSVQQILRKF